MSDPAFRLAASLLLLAFLAIVLLIALLRHLADFGSVGLNDAARYLFSILVLISVLAAFLANRHVRTRKPGHLSQVSGNPVELMVLWVPTFFVIGLVAFPGAWQSIVLLEGSREPGGLGGYFLVRAALPVVCLTIAILAFWRALVSVGKFRQ